MDEVMKTMEKNKSSINANHKITQASERMCIHFALKYFELCRGKKEKKKRMKDKTYQVGKEQNGNNS